MSRIVHVSPGAARLGYTVDAESDLPSRLNPLEDVLGRVRNCEQALVALTLYDPEPVRSESGEPTEDTRQDVNPETEQSRVASSMNNQAQARQRP